MSRRTTPMADTNTNKETALLLSRIGDIAEQCRSLYYPTFLGFLDTAQHTIAAQYLRHSGLTYDFWGGYDDAERVFVGVFPDGVQRGLYPFRTLEFTYRAEDTLTHRDFLGSLMALRLRRDTIGDICVEVGRTVIFVSDHAAELALRELCKVGSVGITTRELTVGEVSFTRSFAEVRGTAASLRLDCIVAMLGNLSRSEASRLITSGLVALGGVSVQEVTHNILVGDRISIRGIGKFIFDGQDGVSRKDKLRLNFKKYQ